MSPEAEARWSSGVVPDLSGTGAYLILVRGAADAERLPRGEMAVRFPYLTMKSAAADYAPAVLEFFEQRAVSTFNHACVEMFGITADVAPDELVDTMWCLVEAGQIEHTMEAPVYFRRVRR